MRKTPIVKLAVKRDTLRALCQTELARVVGAEDPNTTMFTRNILQGCTNGCFGGTWNGG